jgi:outer membrane biosynthesis protein TonB
VNQEYHLGIKAFYYKSDGSSEEEPKPSTAWHFENESQKTPNTEQIEDPNPNPNPEPSEETKPEMSNRGTSAVKDKRKLK